MKELRIGLVLYGGVSLAVYMNGVVTEIWQALRASRHRSSCKPQIDGTAAVYSELTDELRETAGGADLRIVVDTIAGTSAGGVNGVVLGKAIATGADASVLNTTWVKDAGIENLAADPSGQPSFWIRAIDWSAAQFVPPSPGFATKLTEFPESTGHGCAATPTAHSRRTAAI